MSVPIPPIPPLFGTSFGNPGSPNVNRIDTMPKTTDPINTTTTTNVSQSVVDENLSNFLIQEEGLMSQMFLLLTKRILQFVHVCNPLPKRQNQWSNAESRLANQDKRLKSIIISCLPNDVMKSVIKCKTAKEMRNDLILAHEGPSDTRDTKIAALKLKFNSFKSLEGEKVNGTFTRLKCLLNDLENNGVSIPKLKSIDSDVEEYQRTSNEFMADLNAEYHERALLANQKGSIRGLGGLVQLGNPWTNPKKLVSHITKENTKDLKAEMAILTKRIDDLTKGKSEKGKNEKGKSDKGLIDESFDWDEESVSLEDEGTTKIRAFMAIAEDEPYVGKADARSGQWFDITMRKVHKLLSMTDDDERKHVLDYTHVDLHYVEDQRKNLVNKFRVFR
ncbi:hypothetical protein Tco_1315106 [Tanacetum coccineum]